jgi:hypothetical protein
MVHVAPPHQRHSCAEEDDVVEEDADVVEEVGNIENIYPPHSYRDVIFPCPMAIFPYIKRKNSFL